VDAALVGLDRGESVTIRSLPDIADWEVYEAARQNMIPKLSLSSPAARYGVTAALGYANSLCVGRRLHVTAIPRIVSGAAAQRRRASHTRALQGTEGLKRHRAAGASAASLTRHGATVDRQIDSSDRPGRAPPSVPRRG
jgi:hypothetical protein